MPIYEYRCSACTHELEALQKLSEPPLVTCPSCGAATLVKKVSAAGFQLKGSGWYATDFRNAGKPAPKADKSVGDGKPDAGGADAKPADAKSDAKSETKPDAKSDTKSEAKPAAAAPAASAPSTSGSKPD